MGASYHGPCEDLTDPDSVAEMSARARVYALFGCLVAGSLACSGTREGPVPPSRAEAPPPFAVAPEFSLPDSEGQVHRLAELVGPRGLILVIYRGHW